MGRSVWDGLRARPSVRVRYSKRNVQTNRIEAFRRGARRDRGFGLDAEKVSQITGEVAEVHDLGVEVGMVVGGGNFFRGVEEQAKEMDRVSADNMGMLSTVINAIALQDALEHRGMQCRVMSEQYVMNEVRQQAILTPTNPYVACIDLE